MQGGYYFTTGSSFSISSPLHTSYTKNISCANSRLDGVVTSHQSCQPQQTTTTSIFVPLNVTAEQAEIFEVDIQLLSLKSIPTVTSVSPASGRLQGDTVITIGGTNFVSGVTTVSVKQQSRRGRLHGPPPAPYLSM